MRVQRYLLAILGRLSIDQRHLIAWASVLLMIAGATAYRFVDANGGLVTLLICALALAVSALMLRSASMRVHQTSRSEATAVVWHSNEPAESIAENASLENPRPIAIRIAEPDGKSQVYGTQQSLDFDGLGELKLMEQITGAWLASNASDAVSTKLRQACMSLIEDNETELTRVGRWFDISDCLRSPSCRALSKAEARRSYVAEVCGVSKEQVRQIDQGRYAPLNKLLELVNPQTL